MAEYVCPSCKEVCAKVADIAAKRYGLSVLQNFTSYDAGREQAALNILMSIRALPSPPADAGEREALEKLAKIIIRAADLEFIDLGPADGMNIADAILAAGFRRVGPEEVVIPAVADEAEIERVRLAMLIDKSSSGMDDEARAACAAVRER